MAEVNKNNKTKSKESLSNEELLEQIINKKKNKLKNSSSLKKRVVNNSGNCKNSKVKKSSANLKSGASSDEIYENIIAKRTIKKRSVYKNTVEIVDNRKHEVKESVNSIEDKYSNTIKELNQKNSDLIITREIRFDDLSSNLKNKKTLEELRNAIEEYGKLNGDNFENSDLKDDIELLPSVRYSNYKLKKTLIIISLIFLLILLILGVVFGIFSLCNGTASVQKKESSILDEGTSKEVEEKRKLLLYEDCLHRLYNEIDDTDEIVNAKNNLKNYIKDNYYASVSYEDLTYGFSFSYDEDKIYYAASTVKALVALYVYTKAASGEINLDDTITYAAKYKVSYSSGVSNHKIGSQIKIRDLVKYSVIYSDNSAHQMLVAYISKSKLKEFGNNLGAKNSLSGGDNFGNTSSNDGLMYMKAINNFIETGGELGVELKSYFVKSKQNELSVNNIPVAHKYGSYKKYYHNMGIVYDERVYVVSIMTLEGNRYKIEAVKNISQRVYDLHNLFVTNRRNVCQAEIYGN